MLNRYSFCITNSAATMLFNCNGILQNVFYATCVAATITIAILAIFWSNAEENYDNWESESNSEKFEAEYMDADEFYRHSILYICLPVSVSSIVEF